MENVVDFIDKGVCKVLSAQLDINIDTYTDLAKGIDDKFDDEFEEQNDGFDSNMRSNLEDMLTESKSILKDLKNFETKCNNVCKQNVKTAEAFDKRVNSKDFDFNKEETPYSVKGKPGKSTDHKMGSMTVGQDQNGNYTRDYGIARDSQSRGINFTKKQYSVFATSCYRVALMEQSIMTTIASKQLSQFKTMIKECRALYIKAASYGKKEEAAYLYPVIDEGVCYEVDNMFDSELTDAEKMDYEAGPDRYEEYEA